MKTPNKRTILPLDGRRELPSNGRLARLMAFRSAFRHWAGDKTQFQPEVIEAALAHRAVDATERANRRADALDKRRELMEAWGRFCSGDGPIVNLRDYRRQGRGGER